MSAAASNLGASVSWSNTQLKEKQVTSKQERRIDRRLVSLVKMADTLREDRTDELVREAKENAAQFAISQDTDDVWPLYQLGAFQVVTRTVSEFGEWLTRRGDWGGPIASRQESEDYQRGYNDALTEVCRRFAPTTWADTQREERQAAKRVKRQHDAERVAFAALTPDEQIARMRDLVKEEGLLAASHRARRLGFNLAVALKGTEAA